MQRTIPKLVGGIPTPSEKWWSEFVSWDDYSQLFLESHMTVSWDDYSQYIYIYVWIWKVIKFHNPFHGSSHHQPEMAQSMVQWLHFHFLEPPTGTIGGDRLSVKVCFGLAEAAGATTPIDGWFLSQPLWKIWWTYWKSVGENLYSQSMETSNMFQSTNQMAVLVGHSRFSQTWFFASPDGSVLWLGNSSN